MNNRAVIQTPKIRAARTVLAHAYKSTFLLQP